MVDKGVDGREKGVWDREKETERKRNRESNDCMWMNSEFRQIIWKDISKFQRKKNQYSTTTKEMRKTHKMEETYSKYRRSIVETQRIYFLLG